MFIASVVVFFLAIYLSLIFLVRVIEFILRVNTQGRGEVPFVVIFLPSLAWAAFYCLLNW